MLSRILRYFRRGPHLTDADLEMATPPIRVDLLTASLTLPAATPPPIKHLAGCVCRACTERFLAIRAALQRGNGSSRARREYVAIVRGQLTNGMRKLIMRRDGFRCQYCLGFGSAKNRPLSVDHIIPLARGGTNDDANLVTSCFACNSAKADMMPDDPKWIAYLTQVRRNKR